MAKELSPIAIAVGVKIDSDIRRFKQRQGFNQRNMDKEVYDAAVERALLYEGLFNRALPFIVAVADNTYMNIGAAKTAAKDLLDVEIAELEAFSIDS